MMKITNDKWLKGKKECLKHCRVAGMGVKVPYCLHCGKKLK